MEGNLDPLIFKRKLSCTLANPQDLEVSPVTHALLLPF
jgi:hypothetical protein